MRDKPKGGMRQKRRKNHGEVTQDRKIGKEMAKKASPKGE